MNILCDIIFCPLIGFVFLSIQQGFISKKHTARIGIFAIFISFLITLFYSINFIHCPSRTVIQELYTWIDIKSLRIDFNLFLDALSLSMLLIVTGVGLLIHIFSAWYMKHKKDYSRYFAYINLFIASMSLLVLADNFVFMYFGWEGVSLCSYLLIGFYYENSYNTWRAFKAFIMTRISDVFFLISIFLIYTEFHTFDFQEIKFLSHFLNIEHSSNLYYITFFLLIGVLGKSAQLPLHTWLSDAMVGPTPVSALIHAATMVTAGIYLITRTYFLFLLTPDIFYIISLIGITTIIISSFSALLENNIKRILAYSTMSQIGYMFLGIGMHAWNAVIVHLMMHAIFKALLFLSAGSLITCCNNEKNIFKLGGLRKELPFLYINFLVGGASLIAFPFFTSGFYSKGSILFSALQNGYMNFFYIGLFCSFLTSLYTFRMIFVVFHGKKSHQCATVNTLFHNIPLLILLIFSTFIGLYIVPSLSFVFPKNILSMNNKLIFETVSSVLSVFGVYLSYYLWIKDHSIMPHIRKLQSVKMLSFFWSKKCSFDYFYNLFAVNCYLYVSKKISSDPAKKIFDYFTYYICLCNLNLLKVNNGHIRWYITSMVLGINMIFIFLVFFQFF